MRRGLDGKTGSQAPAQSRAAGLLQIFLPIRPIMLYNGDVVKYPGEEGIQMPRQSSKTKSNPCCAATNQDLNGLIAKKAHEIYVKGGCKPGRDLDNWLKAEKIVKAECCK
jgi:hypothetical protein